MSPLTAGPAVLEAALAAGARLFRETEVLAIERAGAAFVLRTTRGTMRAGRVLNAAGGWAPRVAAMLGVNLPIRASPIQLIVTETAPPLLTHLLAYADRHLTMKQMAAGNLVMGGGWPSSLDPETERAHVRRESVEGNLWVADRVLPALRSLHVIRTWAAMNVLVGRRSHPRGGAGGAGLLHREHRERTHPRPGARPHQRRAPPHRPDRPRSLPLHPRPLQLTGDAALGAGAPLTPD